MDGALKAIQDNDAIGAIEEREDVEAEVVPA
jgi:hypothetical protein